MIKCYKIIVYICVQKYRHKNILCIFFVTLPPIVLAMVSVVKRCDAYDVAILVVLDDECNHRIIDIAVSANVNDCLKYGLPALPCHLICKHPFETQV